MQYNIRKSKLLSKCGVRWPYCFGVKRTTQDSRIATVSGCLNVGHTLPALSSFFAGVPSK